MKLRVLATMSIGLVLIMSVLYGAMSPTLRAQTTSAVSSQPSGTPVPNDDAALRAGCQDAVTELVAARKLIAAQDALIYHDKDLAALQAQIESGLKNLRTLDAEEKQKLRDAVDAANRQIAALEAEVVVLKKQRMTLFKKIKYWVFGAAVGAAAGALLVKR